MNTEGAAGLEMPAEFEGTAGFETAAGSEQAARSAERDEPIVVASVPRSHVYIRHLEAPETETAPESETAPAPESETGPGAELGSAPGAAVRRLPDPRPKREDTPTGAPWWPPAMLEPEWIRENSFDVFHLHFGFDALSPQDLRGVISALDSKKIPLVYTAHDLQNPHHRDTALHDAHLDVLIPHAAAVITLSQEAAAQIRRRWGVQAHVIPHPHVVDFATIRELGEAPLRRPDEFRVGLHLKSLRTNMVGIPLLASAERMLAGMTTGARRAVLQVDLHRDVYEQDGAKHDAELAAWLDEAQTRGVVELRVHDYFSDRELYEYLSSVDVSLLPYRFGTHSGWMEAGHDLGTRVIAPDVGCYASQGADFTYRWRQEGAGEDSSAQQTTPEEDSLLAALEAAAAAPACHSAREWAEFRRRQRQEIAAAHAAIYRRVVSCPF